MHLQCQVDSRHKTLALTNAIMQKYELLILASNNAKGVVIDPLRAYLQRATTPGLAATSMRDNSHSYRRWDQYSRTGILLD